jgi:hypothetical protein
LKDDAVVSASFIYNVNKLHMCADADVIALEEVHAKVQGHFTKAEAVKSTGQPVLNEMILAEYQDSGDHYRARILEVAGDGKCTVLFVDYGDTGKLDYKDSYKMTPEFMKLPIMGVPILLDGVPAVNMATFKIGGRMSEVMYSGCVLKMLETLEIGSKDTFVAELTPVGNNASLNDVLAQVTQKLSENQ